VLVLVLNALIGGAMVGLKVNRAVMLVLFCALATLGAVGAAQARDTEGCDRDKNCETNDGCLMGVCEVNSEHPVGICRYRLANDLFRRVDKELCCMSDDDCAQGYCCTVMGSEPCGNSNCPVHRCLKNGSTFSVFKASCNH